MSKIVGMQQLTKLTQELYGKIKENAYTRTETDTAIANAMAQIEELPDDEINNLFK